MKFIATKPVSLFWQTVFIFVFAIYAVYRIQKTTRYLTIVLIPFAIISTITSSIFTDFNCVQDYFQLIIIAYDSCLSYEINVILQMIYGGFVVFSIYLIRKWSVQWNKQFPLIEDAGWENE